MLHRVFTNSLLSLAFNLTYRRVTWDRTRITRSLVAPRRHTELGAYILESLSPIVVVQERILMAARLVYLFDMW